MPQQSLQSYKSVSGQSRTQCLRVSLDGSTRSDWRSGAMLEIQMISDLVVTREEVGVEVGSGGVQKLVK